MAEMGHGGDAVDFHLGGEADLILGEGQRMSPPLKTSTQLLSWMMVLTNLSSPRPWLVLILTFFLEGGCFFHR